MLATLIIMVICGCVSQKIASDKGYNNGFWWEFFLCIIGIAIVASKPNNNQNNNNQNQQ